MHPQSSDGDACLNCVATGAELGDQQDYTAQFNSAYLNDSLDASLDPNHHNPPSSEVAIPVTSSKSSRRVPGSSCNNSKLPAALKSTDTHKNKSVNEKVGIKHRKLRKLELKLKKWEEDLKIRETKLNEHGTDSRRLEE